MNRILSLQLVILTCCTSPNSTESENKKDSLTNIIGLDRLDPKDTTTYIGFIRQFTESGEFYTDLYFKDPYDYHSYEEVVNLADSVLFTDDETSRSRIPLEYAKQFFDLSGIQTIEIFDAAGNQLTTGKFVRVELYDDMINSGFVGVFEVANPQITNPSYCIGNRSWNVDRVQPYTKLCSEDFNSTINKFLSLDGKQIWRMEHFSHSQTDEIYSVISVDTTAIIVESKNQKMTILYNSDHSESINEIVFIPLRINGKPVLLANCTIPETDSDWTNLLTFDGNEYKDSKHCRIYY